MGAQSQAGHARVPSSPVRCHTVRPMSRSFSTSKKSSASNSPLTSAKALFSRHQKGPLRTDMPPRRLPSGLQERVPPRDCRIIAPHRGRRRSHDAHGHPGGAPELAARQRTTERWGAGSHLRSIKPVVFGTKHDLCAPVCRLGASPPGRSSASRRHCPRRRPIAARCTPSAQSGNSACQ